MNPRNTHEKKFRTQEMPTSKNFGLTKQPQEKISDPRHTHEKKFQTHKITMRKNSELTKYPGRHDCTMALDPQDP